MKHNKVDFIIDILNKNGFNGYLVGYEVCNMVLNKAWTRECKIYTDATKKELMNIFGELGMVVLMNNKKSNYVSVIASEEDTEVDVNDFNLEGDSIHNIDVYNIEIYDKSKGIEGVLRDKKFTIHAIAYNNKEGFIDKFGGLEDIKKGIIRTFEGPYEVFNSNPELIMKAIRFEAELDFNLDEATKDCIYNLCKAGVLNKLEQTQRYSEIMHLVNLSGIGYSMLKHPTVYGEILGVLKPCIGFEQNNPYHMYTVYEHIAHTVIFLTNKGVTDYRVILAGMLHDIGKPLSAVRNKHGGTSFYGHPTVGTEMARNILSEIGFMETDIDIICDLIKYHDYSVTSKAGVNRLLNKLGIYKSIMLMELKHADFLAHSQFKYSERLKQISDIHRWLNELIAERGKLSVKDIEVNGDTLKKLGYTPGPQYKEILNKMVELVSDNKINNSESELVEYILNNFTVQ